MPDGRRCGIPQNRKTRGERRTIAALRASLPVKEPSFLLSKSERFAVFGQKQRENKARTRAIPAPFRQFFQIHGCYIPFDWRKDFDETYLLSIKFICLAMTDAYIDAHFHEIKKYGSVIESRLDDTDCKIDSLKKDNRIYIEGYARSGEQVTLIDTDYDPTIQTLFQG